MALACHIVARKGERLHHPLNVLLSVGYVITGVLLTPTVPKTRR